MKTGSQIKSGMTIHMNPKLIKLFISPDDFASWLAMHYYDSSEVWLQMYKKSSGKTSIIYSEALDVALCFGWIDGIVKKYDEESYIQRFTPRTKNSKWSKVNKEHVARLIREGKMRESGMSAVEAAKKDGRWEAAYDSPKNATFPPEFLALLKEHTAAKQFFDTLSKANRYSLSYRLQNAKKSETKARLMIRFIEMLEKGETFH